MVAQGPGCVGRRDWKQLGAWVFAWRISLGRKKKGKSGDEHLMDGVLGILRLKGDGL